MTTSSQPPDRVELAAVTDPAGITPALRQQLIDCWIAVSNAGGAAGFPFPPVDTDEVAPVADQLLASLHPDRLRLLLALDRHDQRLLGWVVLAHTPSRLIGHWATVHHLQTHPAHRGKGIGSALMRRLQAIARDDMGLEQLHLAVRGGMGLEAFYARLGWREVGRWPGALRLSPTDDRDEALLALEPL
jgi:GNAT superfamily N-acetyltransferase